MEQFIVRGVDKLTGREVEHRLEAVDAAEAQAMANGAGVAVRSVEKMLAGAEPSRDAALADSLRRIEDAILANTNLVRAMALDMAEIRRAMTHKDSRFFVVLYKRVRLAIVIGILLLLVIVLILIPVTFMAGRLLRVWLDTQL
ncbi:MAG: hypothetical protein KIT54_07090 [Phycisphaeraceae bacterium]|nr:hypothetical protein [Phycisphaeraceae bacterium]